MVYVSPAVGFSFHHPHRQETYHGVERDRMTYKCDIVSVFSLFILDSREVQTFSKIPRYLCWSLRKLFRFNPFQRMTILRFSCDTHLLRLLLLLSIVFDPEESLSAAAMISPADSLVCDSGHIRRVSSPSPWIPFTESRLFRSTSIGVPLLVGGWMEKHENDKFRRLRNDFLPRFHRTLDNYLQYVPAAVLLGMKTIGIESRSSWGRMLLSDAFSSALMGVTVTSLKRTTHVTRPDGSDRHSFPSGHTATAFMTASMLSHEYGYLSPWLSISAYSLATATGLMRMANNKHWLSDVMAGAGIGILSAEFGYWIADALCKDRGLQRAVSPNRFQGDGDLSFLGIYMGFNLPLSRYDLAENQSFQTSTGTVLGLEGAWFPTAHIGWGGKISLSNLQYIINGDEASDHTFDFYTLAVGPYFSLPLFPRFSLGSKLLLNHVWYTDTQVGHVNLQKNDGWGMGTGLSVNLQLERHFGASLFLDYDLLPPPSTHSGEYMHLMTLGGRACIRW